MGNTKTIIQQLNGKKMLQECEDDISLFIFKSLQEENKAEVIWGWSEFSYFLTTQLHISN